MLSKQDIKHWLDHYAISGIHVGKPELLYYRSKTALLDLSAGHLIRSHMAGRYLSRVKGRGMEFDEVRHYQPGDDVRMIDWRVTARAGTPHTKLFREEKERPVFILTDLSSSMHFGSQLLYKSVQACHLAALIAWRVVKQGDRLGGLVYQNGQHLELKPKARASAALAYIHALETFANSEQQDEVNNIPIQDSLIRLTRLAKPGSLITLLSDFNQLTVEAEKALAKLTRHCQVVAYRITDPLEHQLPASMVTQALPVVSGHHSGYIALGNRRQHTEYQQYAQQKYHQQNEIFKRAGISVIDISSAQPLETQI
ncbi:DUF58 domain-containing protein [Gayadomonas joobiniege]|uniref:DUF58 domain-containing protein n=1 Tax=Gayadomonas joobiniege TaxID=1234606 RepID=UPI00036B4789|nr:DUF58 domain-containing protein [Gayadomonas joobiniege]